MYEWIGLAGSVLIIIAFTTKNEKSIRILDAVGAALFILYGVLIKAWATVFLNAVLIIVHLFRFIEMKKKKAQQ